jgi:integrase
VRLTEQGIRKLPVPAKGNKIHYDEPVRGLGLRITAGGAHAFVLNYRIHGRERRITIGPWPEWSATAAREQAKDLRRMIDRGEDPLAERQQLRTDPTFGQLVEEYLRVEASKQKGCKEYERLLRRDALPHWGPGRAAEIRRRDVIALIEERAQEAPIAANRLFELLRRVFNFAIRREILEVNPCLLVKKPGREHSKDRVLTRVEIKDLWEALDGPWFTSQTAGALKLLLATAQRPGEIVTMSWSDVDLDDGWWTIPAELAKNGLAHRVPLNAIARDILKALPRVSRWIFPSPDDDRHIHRNALAMAMRRARQRERNPLTVLNFSPHDLRRTAASQMASAGVERFVIGRLLNHAEPGVTKVYDRHSYDEQKRQAADLWSRRLGAVLQGPENATDKVVEFSQ